MIHLRQIPTRYRRFRQIFLMAKGFKGHDHEFHDATDFFPCFGGQWWSISGKFCPDTEDLDRFYVMAKIFNNTKIAWQ